MCRYLSKEDQQTLTTLSSQWAKVVRICHPMDRLLLTDNTRSLVCTYLSVGDLMNLMRLSKEWAKTIRQCNAIWEAEVKRLNPDWYRAIISRGGISNWYVVGMQEARIQRIHHIHSQAKNEIFHGINYGIGAIIGTIAVIACAFKRTL